MMVRLLFTMAIVLLSCPAAMAQDKCMTEKDVLSYAKRNNMVEARCYWNTDTAGSEEEFRCIRTWVSPKKKYFSVTEEFGCFVAPKTHIHKEMMELYKVKEPKAECDDCG